MCGFDYGSLLKTVQVYNIQEETWTLMNHFPYGVKYAQGFVLDRNRFHIVGGQNNLGLAEGQVIREYNLENDVWNQVAQLPIVISNGFALVRI